MSRLLLGLIIIITFTKGFVFAQENFELTSPFFYEASYIGEFISNNTGGIKQGTKYLGMANLKISFDTRNAGLWKGGILFMNAFNTHGGTPARDLSGDYQGVSNIEAGDLTSLLELWYKQSFENISLSIGLQDLANEFAVSEYGALFINSSFGTPSLMTSNIPCPTFPFTALSVQVHININEKYLLKAAVFDGQPDNTNRDSYNISWKLNNNEGMLSITELTYSTGIAGSPGTYKIGAYYHNRSPVIKENDVKKYSNNYGFYFIADQLIMEIPENKKLGMLIQAGVSPYSKNDNYFYFGTGINYTGLFSSRSDDVLGLALAYAGLHNKYYNNEIAVELSYMTRLTENIFLQPDLQYIINPSGTSERLQNALLGVMRVGINF